MTNSPLRLGGDGELLCPFCGFECTHIDTIEVGARREDHPVFLITVDAAKDTTFAGRPYDRDDDYPSSRRHWVELVVDCENCPGGSIVIAQHKGASFVTLKRRLES